MADPSRAHAVAVVGMSGRFPGAPGLEGFWRTIRDGVEALEPFTDADLDEAGVDPVVRRHPNYVRQGTVLPDADRFDAAFFGISPRDAQILDPQQRIFLECAWEALEHAGHAGAAAGQAVGVYAGVGMNTYLLGQILPNAELIASVGGYQLMVGNDKDFLSTRVSYKLDLRGPSFTVQTACSTSLVAVVMACRALQSGECDMALAGGVSIGFPQRAGYLFEEGMIFSPDGHCRPFDALAKGTRSGAGAGIVVLKRLSAAIADGDTVHAVILGAAVNNDGAAKAGYTAPSVEGQVEVIATAQAVAGVPARSIGYVEAHGTATPLGDPIEIAALTQAFRASTPDVGFCRIGSLKANFGHLDAAAGVASLIKTILVLKNRELPPLVNFRSPNPALALETSPFFASAAAAHWPAPPGAPRRAAVSSFGIGGTNSHVVLEEAPPEVEAAPVRDAALLVLSAKTPVALDRMAANLAAHLRTQPEARIADLAWTLGLGRQAFAHRRALVVRGVEHAIDALAHRDRLPVISGAHEGGPRPVAFLFSGQGSQYPGMGASLYREEAVFRDVVDRCAALLEPELGIDLRPVLFGPKDDPRIHETRLTQPALFVTELALASLWRSWGVIPSAMIGHSIGEYVAAHLAGVISLEDALRVVAVRGRLMHEQPPGSMAAISLDAAELKSLLEEGVEIAAVNGPSICTVSGPGPAVERLLERVRGRGVECRPLRTSHAFHSALMDGARAPFEALLRRVALSPPKIPYVSNLTGTWITAGQATSSAYYADHLRRAVRFEDGVRAVAENPAMLLVEVGPGNALTTLARLTLGKDAARRAWSSLPHARESRSDRETALEAAGRLWVTGGELDWTRFQRDGARRVPLPTYPFDRKRFWVEPAATPAPVRGPAMPSASVDDWMHAPTWTRDDSLVKEPKVAHSWLVLASPGSLGEAVARQLKVASGTALLVEPGDRYERLEAARFRVRPGSEEDLAALVRDARAAGARIAGAIVLWTAASEGGGPPIATHYHSLVALAAALDPAFDGGTVRIVVATCGAESVLDEPVRRIEAAMVVGPVITLPTEVPGLELRAVDVPGVDGPDGAQTARIVVAEAAAGDKENLVAWRGGRRWVRRFERLALPATDESALPLKRRGVYLITGGMGGIGLTLARWLAERVQARLVLTSRTELPARTSWGTALSTLGDADRQARAIRAVQAIETAGGEVMVAAADAADEEAMRRAIDAARTRWGAVDGVIHGAGVPGTGGMAFLKQRADVDAVMLPKVEGLRVLVRLLGGSPLDFVALFSSINSLYGAPGVCDYASANAVLDAFVDSAARPASWKRVVAFDWGPWRDVGMAANLVVPDGVRKERERMLQYAIPPAAGAEAFARVLGSGRSRVVITPFDPSLFIAARAGAPGTAEKALEPPAGHPAEVQARPDVSAVFEAPGTDVERPLAGIWSELLGVDRVGVHDNFFELGGHSLLATRVLARIDVVFKVRLTLRDVFDAPTLRTLAEKVAAKTAETRPAASDDREEIEF